MSKNTAKRGIQKVTINEKDTEETKPIEAEVEKTSSKPSVKSAGKDRSKGSIVKDPIQEACAAYMSAGWNIICPPEKNSLVRIIARKDKKYHFVYNIIDVPNEQLNNYVQNAFSNGAEPIGIKYKESKKKENKIIFVNINTQKNVKL